MTWKLPKGMKLVLADNPFIPRVDTGSSCRDCVFFKKHSDYQDTGDGDCLDEWANLSENHGFKSGCLGDVKNIFKLEPVK